MAREAPRSLRGGPGTRPVRRVGTPGTACARRVAAILALLSAAGCSSNGRNTETEDEQAVPQTIEQVLALRAPELMRIPGVEGVGQALCDERPCIRIYLRTAAAGRRVPREVDGFPVSTVVTGVAGPRTSD